MKKTAKEYTHDQLMEVEDSLQAAGIFTNPFTGRTCHSDSYGTIVEFAKLDKWLKDNEFCREWLAACVEYWTTNENMQPPLRLVGFTVKRYLDKPIA